MANIRGLTFEDRGVRWDIAFEYQDDQTQGPWQLWGGQIPRDLGDLNADDADQAMLELGMAIARGQGVPEFND